MSFTTELNCQYLVNLYKVLIGPNYFVLYFFCRPCQLQMVNKKLVLLTQNKTQIILLNGLLKFSFAINFVRLVLNVEFHS